MPKPRLRDEEEVCGGTATGIRERTISCPTRRDQALAARDDGDGRYAAVTSKQTDDQKN
jgi:hypothetical protein